MISVNKTSLSAIDAEKIRARRDALLRDSDWSMMPDTPTDKNVWANYRQALRDITLQKKFPAEVVWPELPGRE
ncbi:MULTISPECIES: tail fiber assembly protein [unclassified Enterobacter]|uniref:tail fiber assembly protein n=1 Tax=unclassified Enterobacter TaxID=2608935 RepID=UPI0008E7B1B0|nr:MULTISPECIES: tail fiber assembly protein [unclassified Enterobacter]SFR13821.1 Phage tail assembly chaperone protein [Enterobacter sp. kpr-6]